MSIVRIQKSERTQYVIMHTAALNDSRLSFRAKGLHTYLMAKPDDWQIHIKQLEKQSPREGREAIAMALKELLTCGYARRERVRDEKGCLRGWQTTVYENIQVADLAEEDAKLEGDDPTENGFADFGSTEVGSAEVGKAALLLNNVVTQNGVVLKSLSVNTQTETPQRREKPVVELSVDELIQGWNEVCGGMGLIPKVTKLGANNRTLRAKIRLRLGEQPEASFWNTVLNKCRRTPFLRGDNERRWKVTLAWLTENDHRALKIYEGNYDR